MAISFSDLELSLSSLFDGKEMKTSVACVPTSDDKDAAAMAALSALLTISKGKEEAEEVVEASLDDNEESDSATTTASADANVEPLPNLSDLPPPPSDLCDCHGVESAGCPGWSFTCNICFDEFQPGEVRRYHAVNCHTFCCESCIADTLSYEIRNGQVSHLNCPSCGWHLLSSEVARRLPAEDVERYHRFLLRKYLHSRPNLHECRSPGCENAVLVEEDGECGRASWTCETCATTCPWCKQPAHPRRRCAAEKKFVVAERRQAVWVATSRSKKCPGCQTPIIKNGGCPHMTCKNPGCGAQWCWMCKGDWNEHDMCPYEKLAIAGIVVALPVLVPVALGLAVAVAAPVMTSVGITGNAIFDGKALVRKGWKYTKRLYYDYF